MVSTANEAELESAITNIIAAEISPRPTATARELASEIMELFRAFMAQQRPTGAG